MPTAKNAASERSYWSSSYLATVPWIEASKSKPHSVVAHIIYEDMLDALGHNSMANEFIQDSE